VEALSHRLYRVEFANGHRLLGHLPGKRSQLSPSPLNGEKAGMREENDGHRSQQFNVGDRVIVEMTPFDFSKGRILITEE